MFEDDLNLYDRKIAELKEMLKYPIYQESEVLKKLEMIDFWAKNKGLDLQNLDRNIVLEIASELHPFYLYLWDAKSIGEWKVKYSNLSIKTRKMYTEEEVREDWDNRQSAKKRYAQIMDYLENSEYLLSQELQNKIENYLKEQVIFPDRKFYFLNHDEVIVKYQKKIILTTTKRANDIDFNLILCAHTNVWISETQVTQALWTAVMGWNPSHFKSNPLHPVECVTWYDCLHFCNLLSQSEGLQACCILSNLKKDQNHIIAADVEWIKNTNGYRLPTTSEWKYAAHALSNTCYSGSNRIDEVAIFENNINAYSTFPVKTKKPNAWGFYDMTGNVWEWSMDEWDLKNSGYTDQSNQLSKHHINQSYLVCGGSYLNLAEDCYIDHHYVHQAGKIYHHQGFRLAKSQINADTMTEAENQISTKQISTMKREIQNLKGIEFHMIYCPKGEFLMGKNQVSTKIEQDFWVAETQITQALWMAVMGWNDSYFHASFKDNPNLPVENITWYDCLFFCNQLSKLYALTSCYLLSNIKKEDEHIIKADVTYINHADGYRLPTSAEWEYASKAGENFTYSGSNCADDVGWFSHNSGILKLDLRHNNSAHENLCCTHTVKTKKPNQWGIYDMSGNVNEWCFERLNQKDDQQVIKGGDCFDLENDLSCHDYKGFSPESKANTIGLRIFRSANS